MQNQIWAGGTPAHHTAPKIDQNTPPNCAEVSIGFADGHARLLMDGLAYGLTAQECGMLAYTLAETVKVLAGASNSEPSLQAALIIKDYKLWYGLIEIRTTSEEEDILRDYGYRWTAHEYFFCWLFP